MGRVTKLDRERFSYGDCHFLARAISRLTGLPICTFMWNGEPETHAFVRLPDGRYLDVEGASTAAELRSRWENPDLPIREISWRTLRRRWDAPPVYGEYSYRRAKTIAALLVNRHAPELLPA